MSSPNKVIKHEDGTWHMSKERSACSECMNLNDINKYRKHQMGFRSKGVTVIGDCEFSEDSECLGNCTLSDSSILDSGLVSDSAWLNKSMVMGYGKVLGDARAYASIVAEVACVCGQAKIFKTSVGDSAFIGGTATVHNSVIKENSRVIENGFVMYSSLSGQATVEGGQVIGTPKKTLNLHPLAFIHAGTWRRSPIVYKAQLSDFTVQECVDGRVHIGCLCGKPEKWVGRLDAGEKYGTLVGLNYDQIDELRGLVYQVVEETKELEIVKS